MFINIVYKDEPELSTFRRQSNVSGELVEDPSTEKVLLVNPNCPVRIMLEYIRKKCKLGIYSQFDLCDETGSLMKLFSLPTYAYATEKFEHKKTYYLIVLKQEADKRLSILPQINYENHLYEELKSRIQFFIATGATSALNTSPAGKSTPLGKVTPPGKATPPGKVTPPGKGTSKPSAKKK